MNKVKNFAGVLLVFALLSFRADRDCNHVPALNAKIVEFVKQHVGKQVDRGECWDLAAGALNKAGAKWDGNYGFGEPVNYKKECVFPGDIIQFENVFVKFTKGNTVYTQRMAKHTAVVMRSSADGTFEMAEQNTTDGGRKVRIAPFDPASVQKGKFTFYRPVAD